MTGEDYQYLFEDCSLTSDPTRLWDIKSICKTMVVNQITYWGVEKTTGVPWYVVAAIHYRESSQSFKCHLHNGDPLTQRTVHVPAGRPKEPNPPYTWTQSAVDALMDRPHPEQWSIGGCLEFCEQYNGLGYLKHGLNSPYVWSGTDMYKCGLFIADGTLDPNRKDSRPGVAALFKILLQAGVDLDHGFEIENTAKDNLLH